MSAQPEKKSVKSVEIEHVEKHYAGFHALHDINMALDPGEFTVMVGPSGCGKSTLLKTIAGLESVSSGTLRINGRDVTREEPGDRGIAMVFQSYALYPHMTVAENMGFGLRMAKRPKAEIEAAVSRAAKILRITEQLDKLPRQLSGGQRQRVAIGRAITRSPDVFLFDEPLSNLDAALRTQMRVELSTLHAELGSTMIYVTHDQVEAMTMASRIVVLNGGRIEQIGSPLDLYDNPTNHFVASFLGAPRMNFLEGRVEAADGTGARVEVEGLPPLVFNGLTATPKPNEAVRIGLRPEHLQVVEAGENGGAIRFEGTLRLYEDLGRESILYVDASPVVATGSDTGTTNLSVHTTRAIAPAPGSRLSLGFDTSDAYLFAADGRTISARKPHRTR